MYYIGVDPGLTGAIAVITPDDYYVYHMPTEVPDLIDLIYELKGPIRIRGHMTYPRVCIEQVAPWKSSAGVFKFGKNAGALETGFRILTSHVQMVLPRIWQKPFGLLRTDKEESDTDKKNRHKDKALELFPDIPVTHQIADALLIAQYCKDHFCEIN